MWRGLALLTGVAVLLGGAFLGVGHAASCVVPGAWNPDPNVSNAGPCGPGNDANNESTEVLNGITFEEWDKDEAPNDTSTGSDPKNGGFYYTGSTSGFWYWNATKSLAEGNDTFALILKDGNSGPAEPVRWAWFILDNPGGPSSGWLANPITAGACAASATIAFTHCGTYSMYGVDGTLKSVSHMSLYGADTVGVPEPGTLVLLGLGLVAAGTAVRRLRKKAA